jgi:hypothetical protein
MKTLTKIMLALALACAGFADVQPKLVLTGITAAMCAQMPLPFCTPMLDIYAVNLPAGSAVRLTVTYTDTEGQVQAAIRTIDANEYGTAFWLLMTTTDFKNPSVSGVLLLASGPIVLK